MRYGAHQERRGSRGLVRANIGTLRKVQVAQDGLLIGGRSESGADEDYTHRPGRAGGLNYEQSSGSGMYNDVQETVVTNIPIMDLRIEPTQTPNHC